MKRIITSLLLVMSFTIGAQTLKNQGISSDKNYPSYDWQIGTTFSNLIMQSITLDANFRYNRNKTIGVNFSRVFGYTENTAVTTLDGTSSFSNRDFKGYELAVFQKIYFYKTFSDNYYYFRHGVRGDRNVHTYSREDWFNIQDNGLNFLVFEERDFEEVSFRIGYDALIGIELNYGRFSTDIFTGVAYYQQLSDEISSSYDINDPSYEGFRPVLGFRFALNLGVPASDLMY